MVKTHRPFLAWFGAMNLAPHFWQFLGLGTSEVNISFHKSEKFSVFLNRKEAENFQKKIVRLGYRTAWVVPTMIEKED